MNIIFGRSYKAKKTRVRTKSLSQICRSQISLSRISRRCVQSQGGQFGIIFPQMAKFGENWSHLAKENLSWEKLSNLGKIWGKIWIVGQKYFCWNNLGKNWGNLNIFGKNLKISSCLVDDKTYFLATKITKFSIPHLSSQFLGFPHVHICRHYKPIIFETFCSELEKIWKIFGNKTAIKRQKT